LKIKKIILIVNLTIFKKINTVLELILSVAAGSNSVQLFSEYYEIFLKSALILLSSFEQQCLIKCECHL